MPEIHPKALFAYERLKPFLLSFEEIDALLQRNAPFTPMRGARGNGLRAGERDSIDFRLPAMPAGRARNDAGGTPFHLSYYPISNAGQPTLGGTPYYPIGRRPRKTSSSFEAYLGRDGSAELLAGVSNLNYIEREAALELEKLLSEFAEGADAQAQTPIISNISATQAAREGFWGLIAKSARVPRTHALIAHPSRHPAFWDKVPEMTWLPEFFHQYLLRVREAYRAWNSCDEEGRFKPERLKVSAEEAGQYLHALRFHGPLQPVTFKSGPGGRTQYRMEIELPHEISPYERWWIMKEFCKVLASYKLMYTAALHRPGLHGDKRNNHFHVIFIDRPARLIEVAADIKLRSRDDPTPPPGVETVWEWDFAVEVHNGSKKNPKIIRPFGQPKSEIVSQSQARTGDKDSGLNFAKRLRRHYARIVNLVLAAKGADYHYDPRRYENMGIGLTPSVHLGSAMAALEADGIPTVKGTRNAINRFRDFEEGLMDAFVAAIGAADDAERDVERRLTAPTTSVRTNAVALRQLAAKRRRITYDIAHDRLWIRKLDLYVSKAGSRALLVQAAPKREIHRSKEQEVDLENRALQATAFLEAVADAWARAQKSLDELRADIAQRQAEADRITVEIEAGLQDPTRRPLTGPLGTFDIAFNPRGTGSQAISASQTVAPAEAREPMVTKPVAPVRSGGPTTEINPAKKHPAPNPATRNWVEEVRDLLLLINSRRWPIEAKDGRYILQPPTKAGREKVLSVFAIAPHESVQRHLQNIYERRIREEKLRTANTRPSMTAALPNEPVPPERVATVDGQGRIVAKPVIPEPVVSRVVGGASVQPPPRPSPDPKGNRDHSEPLGLVEIAAKIIAPAPVAPSPHKPAPPSQAAVPARTTHPAHDNPPSELRALPVNGATSTAAHLFDQPNARIKGTPAPDPVRVTERPIPRAQRPVANDSDPVEVAAPSGGSVRSANAAFAPRRAASTPFEKAPTAGIRECAVETPKAGPIFDEGRADNVLQKALAYIDEHHLPIEPAGERFKFAPDRLPREFRWVFAEPRMRLRIRAGLKEIFDERLYRVQCAALQKGRGIG